MNKIMNNFYSLHQGTLFYVCVFNCVHYEVDFVKSRFVISRFCSIHFIVNLAQLKKIVHYTGDFVI